MWSSRRCFTLVNATTRSPSFPSKWTRSTWSRFRCELLLASCFHQEIGQFAAELALLSLLTEATRVLSRVHSAFLVRSFHRWSGPNWLLSRHWIAHTQWLTIGSSRRRCRRWHSRHLRWCTRVHWSAWRWIAKSSWLSHFYFFSFVSVNITFFVW